MIGTACAAFTSANVRLSRSSLQLHCRTLLWPTSLPGKSVSSIKPRRTSFPSIWGPPSKAVTELHVISNEISHARYSDGTSVVQLTEEQALHFNERLEAWFNALPDELLPSKIALLHQLEIQLSGPPSRAGSCVPCPWVLTAC